MGYNDFKDASDFFPMESNSPKKLIPIFLALSGTTCIVLLLASFLISSHVLGIFPAEGNDNMSDLVQNSSGKSPNSSVSQNIPVIKPNLTRKVAQAMAEKLLILNPNGFQNASSGNMALIIPGHRMLGDTIKQAATAVSMADLGLTTSTDGFSLIVTDDGSLSGVMNYATAIKSAMVAMDENIVTNNGSMLSPSSQADALASAIKTIQGIPVPRTLENFDRALLLALTHLNEIDASVNSLNNDPIASLILAQHAGDISQHDMAVLTAELNRTKDTIGVEPEGLKRLLLSLVTILPAHADEVPVHDQDVLDKLKDILTTLENTLKLFVAEWKSIAATNDAKMEAVQELQQDILTWIVNTPATGDAATPAGDSRFVTNWQTHLQDAYNNGVDFAINQVIDETNKSGGFTPEFITFLTQLRSSLLQNNNSPKSSDFFQSKDGSEFDTKQDWKAFVGNASPSSSLDAYEKSVEKYVQSQADQWGEAFTLDAQAGQGFLSKKVCLTDAFADSSNPDPYGVVGKEFSQVIVRYDSQGNFYPCGSYKITIPGSMISNSAFAALQSAINEIVNSQYIPDYVGGIWDDSLINTEISSPANGLGPPVPTIPATVPTGVTVPVPTDPSYP